MPTTFATPINNVSTKLASAYTAGAGSLSVVSASSLPALSGGHFYRVTVIKANAAYTPTVLPTDYTIFKVTAVSGNTLTVAGVLDNTTDTNNFGVGAVVEVRVTSGTVSDIQVAVNTLESAPGPPVTSVFTRTGAILGQTGDYSVGQITGAAPMASPTLSTPTFTGSVIEPVPTWPAQSANQFLAGPASGSAAAPAFRSISAAADIQAALNSPADVSSPTVLSTPVHQWNSTTYENSLTARSLARRLGEVYNARDWGVLGDNSGTDDAPAIQALIDHVVGKGTSSILPKTIYFPTGSYTLGSTLYIAQLRDGVSTAGTQLTGLNFVGDGFGTRFRPAASFPNRELIRFEDVAACRIGGFFLDINQPIPATGTKVGNTTGPNWVDFRCSVALHITATGSGATIGSSEHVRIDDVWIDGNSNNYPFPTATVANGLGHTYPANTNDSQTLKNNCWVGFGISLEYPNDISEHRYYNINSKNCSLAAIMGGNGSPQNILDCSFFHCTAEHSPVGVFMNAFPIYWYSGTVLSNKVVDFFNATNMSSSPTVINGLRTENSCSFWWSFGGSASASVTLSNCFIQAYHGWNHTQSGSGNTNYYSQNPYSIDGSGNPNCFGITSTGWDGYAIKHGNAGSINVTGCSIGKAPSGRQVQTTYAGGGLALYVYAANNVFDGEASAGSEIVNKYLPRGNVFFNIVGQGTTNSGVPVRGRMGNIFSDHTMVLGGRVGIGCLVSDETITPTYGLYQLGGSHRLQQIPAPDPAHITISTVGTPGSTSYTYYIVSVDTAGNKSLPSSGVTITTGNATLGSSNYNTITWQLVEGAINYDILRGDTAHSCTGGVGVFNFSASYTLEYTVRTLSPAQTATFNDKNNATVAYTTPSRNATGDSTIDGTLTVGGAITGSNLSGTNTGDQTITLTGNVTGSGTGSFATTIASGVVTNAMLAGSIAAAKLVGSDIVLTESQVTSLVTDLAAKAPLASPTFTGTPAAPTAAVGTNTTQIATTSFVRTNPSLSVYSLCGGL